MSEETNMEALKPLLDIPFTFDDTRVDGSVGLNEKIQNALKDSATFGETYTISLHLTRLEIAKLDERLKNGAQTYFEAKDLRAEIAALRAECAKLKQAGERAVGKLREHLTGNVSEPLEETITKLRDAAAIGAMTMADNVDFKRVRGSAEDIVAFYAKFDRPLSHEQARELENARAILALCELLKDALPAVSHAQNMMADNDVAEAWVVLERRINAAIGE